MTRRKAIVAWCCWCVLCGIIPASHAGVDEAALRLEGEALADRFAAELKPRLLAALEAGGPVNAIDVCADEAPALAARLAAASGWSVRRVSLRARNADTATPDAWEREVLQGFDAAVARGEPPVVTAAMVDGQYRLLKPQLVQGLCLACHGEVLQEEVRAALVRHYPNDNATGYQPGEVRGAISVALALPAGVQP